MRNGELVQVDTPAGVLERPEDDYVRRFVQRRSGKSGLSS